MRGPADCKSAIQQITNLRYGGSVDAPVRSKVAFPIEANTLDCGGKTPL